MFDGESVWIANQADDTIQRLEPDGSEGLVVSLPDFYPRALAFDGDTMWLATFFGIRMLGPDYQIVASFRPGRRPAALKYAGGYIFASNNDDGTITTLALPQKIRELGGELPQGIPPDHMNPMPIGNYKVGSNPIAMEWDGSNLWVANYYDNTVMKLRPSDGTVLATVEVGDGPRGMTFDGQHMWVVNALDGTVSKMSQEGSVVATFDVGALPSDVEFDGESVWVSNRQSETVNRMGLNGENLGTFHLGRPPRRHGVRR